MEAKFLLNVPINLASPGKQVKPDGILRGTLQCCGEMFQILLDSFL